MAYDINGFSITSSPTELKLGTYVSLKGGNASANTGLVNTFGTAAFSGRVTSGTAASRLNQTPIAVNSIELNNKARWSSTTWSCAHAGLYFASMSVIVLGQGVHGGTSNPTNYCGIRKNGVLYCYTLAQSANHWDNVVLSGIIKCAANDTITFGIGTGLGLGGSGSGFYNYDLNQFAVFYLG